MNRAQKYHLAAIRVSAMLSLPPLHHEVAMQDDPIADAREHIAAAIAELKARNIDVPLALFRAMHALNYNHQQEEVT